MNTTRQRCGMPAARKNSITLRTDFARLVISLHTSVASASSASAATQAVSRSAQFFRPSSGLKMLV